MVGCHKVGFHNIGFHKVGFRVTRLVFKVVLQGWEKNVKVGK